jgi:hypothetical protein
MNSPEVDPFKPTHESIMADMLSSAIGWDNPMTPEAVESGMDIVRERIDRAKEILAGEPITPERRYDTEAINAVMLLEHEQKQARLASEDRLQQICDFPESATDYFAFLYMELNETVGASFYCVHPIAPPDVTEVQLALMADELKYRGWNAEVARRDGEGDDSPLGIRIVSEEE